MGNRYYDHYVWQRAMDLAAACYETTDAFRDEGRDLIREVRAVASMIPGAIAKGFGRGSNQEFLRQLRLVHGTLLELESMLLLATRVGFCDASIIVDVLAISAELSRDIRKTAQGLEHRTRHRRRHDDSAELTPASWSTGITPSTHGRTLQPAHRRYARNRSY